MFDIIQACPNCSQTKAKITDNLSDGICSNCTIRTIAIRRYADANVPVEYWDLSMDDFHGPAKLKTKYDEIVNNLPEVYKKGYTICLAGQHGTGKQLCLETELPTPKGFVKLKDLNEGDQLFDETGAICSVTKLHPINISPESYRIYFDDGSTIDACADHLWSTWTRADRSKLQQGYTNVSAKIRSTKEILTSLRFKNGIREGTNHSIPCAMPIQYPVKDLPIDPYVLGCWLGDGHARNGRIESADIGILNQIKKAGYTVTKIKTNTISKSSPYAIGPLVTVKRLGRSRKNKPFEATIKMYRLRYELTQMSLLNNKHIPQEYLHSSYQQRLALLQGLMDTDGSCQSNGLAEFSSCYEHLAEQTAELVRSLGIKCNVKRNKASLAGYDCLDRYRVTFTTTLPVFRLKRKLKNIRKIKNQITRTTHRFIVDIKPIDSKPMRCLTVDSPSHLFLVGRSFIPTHNTTVLTNIVKAASLKGYTGLYTSLSDIATVSMNPDMDDRFAAQRELKSVDFLVIDEIDDRFLSQSIQSNEFFSRLFEITLRTRIQNSLPTFIATNSPNLREVFGGAFKASLGSLLHKFINVTVVGEDFRKKSK